MLGHLHLHWAPRPAGRAGRPLRPQVVASAAVQDKPAAQRRPGEKKGAWPALSQAAGWLWPRLPEQATLSRLCGGDANDSHEAPHQGAGPEGGPAARGGEPDAAGTSGAPLHSGCRARVAPHCWDCAQAAEPSLKGYLQFLAESRVVYSTLEQIMAEAPKQECEGPGPGPCCPGSPPHRQPA